MSENEKLTVSLKRPLTVDGKTLSTLELRRPLVRDLIAADRQQRASGPVAGDAALLAEIAGVPFAEFGSMDAVDYNHALREAIAGGFFGVEKKSAATS